MPIEMHGRLPFSVDTFTPTSKIKRHHFLTHAHKDHCSGISSHFSYPIYSTNLTKLIILRYFPQLDEKLFVEIEVGQSIVIDDPDGSFKVTAFDANHCPGAVMFLFEGDFGNVLHTGDCRLTSECLLYLPDKYLARKGKEPSCPLDFVFLDCTFGKSLMKIPSKQSALQQVINCIWKHPDALTAYLTSDLLGHEEILVHVSETFGSKIYVDKAKHPDFYQTLQLIAPQIISEDCASRLHLFEGFPKLYERAKKKISEAHEKMEPEPLIVRASAQWYAHEETELTVMERKILEKLNMPVKDSFGVWHVCYSMHSSRQELEWALELLAPKWVVSTTPECRAMELEYVKKHCSRSQASSACLWKLLDFTTESSSNILAENSSDCTIAATDIAAVKDSVVQLPMKLPNKRVLNLSPVSKRPPVTLFGRARLGYRSCISFKELKPRPMDGLKQKLGDHLERKVSQSIDDDGGSTIEKPKEFKMNQVEQKVSQSIDDGGESTIEKPKESKMNLVGQKISQSLFVENVAEKPIEHLTEAGAPDVESDMHITETTVYKSVSHSSSGSLASYSSYTFVGYTKVFSDNLRKLYRSMNVPIPKTLPSLVELMKSNKRARRHYD